MQPVAPMLPPGSPLHLPPRCPGVCLASINTELRVRTSGDSPEPACLVLAILTHRPLCFFWI